jgi:hypothetical protein
VPSGGVGRRVIEQAADVGAGEVHLGTDGGRCSPEREQGVEGRPGAHEGRTPGVGVDLHVVPEVALPALRTVDHRPGDVAQLLHSFDGRVDAAIDLEEETVIPLGVDDPDGLVNDGVVGQEPAGDCVRDEGVDVDQAEVERLVFRAGQRAENAADVQLDQVQLSHDVTEAGDGVDQMLVGHTEQRVGRQDDVLDGHVAMIQVRDGQAQCPGARNRELMAHLVRRLVVIPSHWGYSSCGARAGTFQPTNVYFTPIHMINNNYVKYITRLLLISLILLTWH